METPGIMKKRKKVLPMLMATALCTASMPLTVQADSSKVVTLGANLSEEQKESMYEYFGTSADEVVTIEVNNSDERKYMEGIATEEQIGTRTFSCSYVEPTSSGGVQVKTANLTYVTSSMISSTLLTSGVENCNVVAASPIAVSGTGALTGIMMAYETASGETLDEGQKEAATEELVTTGELADEFGDETASGLMNDIKEKVIEDDITDTSEIQDIVSDTANSYNITLTEDQMNKITSLMETIAQYDYDVKALKETLDNLSGESGGFFSNLWDSIVGFFTGDDSDGGIINDTQDDILGTDIVIDSTLDSSDSENSGSEEEGGGFWDSIINFFKDLFGIDDDSSEDTADTADTPAESSGTENSGSTDSSSDSTGENTDTDQSGTAPATENDTEETDSTGSDAGLDGNGSSPDSSSDADSSVDSSVDGTGTSENN